MITVHSGWADDFSSLGLCPLVPIECTVEEHAGGMFQLKMTHPMDKTGKWWHLQKWNIIKAPAPMRETPLLNISAADGNVTRQIYRVNVSSRLRLRTKPSTSSGKIIGRYKSGTEVVRIGESGSWYQVVIKDGGATGWMYSDYLDYVGTETQAPAQNDRPPTTVTPRQTREQLFRIMTVDRDDAAQLVYITALHVFYDLTGQTIAGEYSPEDIEASDAVREVFEKSIKPHGFEVYANAKTKITGAYGGRNIASALTEKDGIVRLANARLIRDNFDVFVLEDEQRDRGVEIRHGKNMLGAVLTEDVSDVVATIIPVGENKDGEPIYIDGLIVDAENADELPVVRSKEIKYNVKSGTEEYPDDEAVKKEILRLAKLEFEENGINHGAVGLDVDFVALENTRQYERYAALQSVHLYDTVRVISSRSGIDARVRMTGYVYNCLTKRYDSATFGELFALDTAVSGFDIMPNTVSGNRLVQGSVDGSVLRNASILYAKIAQATIEQLNADAIAAVSGKFDEIIAGSLTAEKLYATVAEIMLLRFGEITGETVDTDELYAELAEIILLRAQQINAENITTDKLAAQYAEIVALLVENIRAENIEADRLGAVLANFVTMYAQTGEFDFATIQNLVAQAMALQQGSMDTVYIRNLAVTSANMLSATLGKLVIKGDDGKYYRVFVGSDGTISTEEVPEGDLDAETDGGRQIVETTMNVGSLNATNLQASSAVINSILTTALSAEKITAADALIASATIPALYATTIQAIGNSLELIVGRTSEVWRGEEPPEGAQPGDLWVQPSTGFIFQMVGEVSADFYLDGEGVLYSDGGGYFLDENGDLYSLPEDAFALGDDGTVMSWQRVKDSELSAAELKLTPEGIMGVVTGAQQWKEMENAADEMDAKLAQYQSEFTQRMDGFELSVERMVDGDELRTYLRYQDGRVEIGRSDSRYTTETSDAGFVVLQDGVEMTSMVKNTMAAPVIEAKRQFQTGSFIIRAGADGGLLIL